MWCDVMGNICVYVYSCSFLAQMHILKHFRISNEGKLGTFTNTFSILTIAFGERSTTLTGKKAEAHRS